MRCCLYLSFCRVGKLVDRLTSSAATAFSVYAPFECIFTSINFCWKNVSLPTLGRFHHVAFVKERTAFQLDVNSSARHTHTSVIIDSPLMMIKMRDYGRITNDMTKAFLRKERGQRTAVAERTHHLPVSGMASGVSLPFKKKIDQNLETTTNTCVQSRIIDPTIFNRYKMV